MKKFQKKACIILTAAVVGLFALTGCTQSAQNQTSEQPSTQSSEQSQTSEQSSAQSSEPSQTSEQSSTQSSEPSQTSEQSYDEPTSSAEPSSPKEKIRLFPVEDIIAEAKAADKPENIFDEIYQTYQYDEDLSTEMREHLRYWIDDDHTKAIDVIRYDSKLPCSVFYNTYDSQGQIINPRLLYKYQEKISLAAVKDMISKKDPDVHPLSFISEMAERFKYDKRHDGGALTVFYYWLNEKHTEEITINFTAYYDASVNYHVLDSEEHIIKSETLYEYSYEYSATETSPTNE